MVKFLDNNSGFNQWNANRNKEAKKSGWGGFLWWIALFLFSWWLIGLWLGPKETVNPPAATEQQLIEEVTDVPVTNIASDKLSVDVQGLRFSNMDLKDFPKNADASDKNNPIRLLGGKNNFIEVGLIGGGTSAPTANTIWNNKGGILSWKNSDGVSFTRTLSVKDYIIKITDRIQNTTKQDLSFAPYARIVRDNDMQSSAGVYTGLVAYVNSDIEHEDWHKLDKKSYAYSTTSGFAGFVDQYWETIVSIDSPDQTVISKKLADKYTADVAAAPVQVKSGQSAEIETYIFAGPRDRSALEQASNIISGIEETVDYGWFWFLAMPMLWILGVINSFVMNYGVAIIILTILLRFAMWPLTRKSYTSMIAMQKMQPEMLRLQKLYGNDKARLQMEMMKLYQTHKTSPMSGCLPMLLQIPIFFALYKALLISVQMRSASFLWIKDLAAMDPYFILPILMGLTMWLQQYLQSAKTPDNKDKNDPAAQTQKVMKWMPLIFTVMFAWMPAGLVLYWTVSNIFGIVQMYIIKRRAAK